MKLLFYNEKLNKIELGNGEIESYLEIIFMSRNGWTYIGIL